LPPFVGSAGWALISRNPICIGNKRSQRSRPTRTLERFFYDHLHLGHPSV
jgi:hypothetical protein